MASVATGLLTGMGLGVGYGILSDYARLGTMWAKWKAINAVSPNFMKDVFATTMQSILSAEKDEVTGLSSAGTIDVMFDFINKTIDMSLLINEGIATQMFIQMIQQSIAYAIHSSHAGAIGTIGNVYSGSSSLSVAYGDNIGSDLDKIDDKLAGFLSASIGANIPTVAYQLNRGANQLLEKNIARLQSDVERIVDEWNDLTMSYYRHHHTLARSEFTNAVNMKKDTVTRAYSIIEQMGHEHLRRIAEQMDSLVACREWFDAELVSEEELIEVANRINLERVASEENYDDYKDSILDAIASAITNWDDYVTQALGDVTNNEEEYRVLLNKMLEPIFIDVANVVNDLMQMVTLVISHVTAYRNIPPAVQYILKEVPPLHEPSEYVELIGEEWVMVANGT